MRHSYQRHLPHQIPPGFPIFLTWNLKGALPAEKIQFLRQQRERLQRQPDRADETPRDRKLREDKLLFFLGDQYLDRATTGPMHLGDPAAAKIVEDSILFGIGERYDLFAWCVMSNHMHVLLKPQGELAKITQGIKGYSAHQINELHGARGRIFWQDECYDHWARDEAEMVRIIHYIEHNPVAAGLCERPEDWPRSSARFRRGWSLTEPYRRP